jgi:hypothetical protein
LKLAGTGTPIVNFSTGKESAMRPFFFATCVIVVVSLAFAAPLEARGGKGGGGGGRGRGNSGGGQGGGGPKWNRQTSHPGGGQRAAHHEHKPAHDAHKHQFADKPPKPDKDKEKHEKPDKHARNTAVSDPANQPSEAYNKKQKQLAIEQQNRDKRIAQAQHLREIGERNGNQNLLDNADRMEAFAHDHYARRVSQLEKFGVTDPLLNPGTGVTDPLLPGTNGLVDPLGGLETLNSLPLLP